MPEPGGRGSNLPPAAGSENRLAAFRAVRAAEERRSVAGRRVRRRRG